ncbi:MAG: hypothetical protein ACD_4C00457G0002 [uncultured bacterium (gcode 4)]|uniref:Uncharacterized protein n=1 Tax=uncultured bacterium (gcode 4) TaxID=1234023 RepID=K2F4N5_9BACT|nr:MAG: hypothetical protein ACD_4C00457G0002 [uncultured bacterium (gcode 4)]
MGLFDSIKNSIKEISEWYLKINEEKVKKFLETIDDPIAKEISWHPLLRWWASFKTHNLQTNQNGWLEYKAVTWAKVFSIIFIIFSFVPLFLIPAFLQNLGYFFLVPVFFWLIFLTGGIYMFKSFSKSIVFDKAIGYFYKWKLKSNMWIIDVSDKNIVPLSNIYALQVISEFIKTDKSSYYSHEINLVLSDKVRINVIDCWNIDSMRNDAKQIWEYLWIPVWDFSGI